MQNTKKSWTQEDDNFLLDTYGVGSMRYMMGQLKRTEESIKQRYKLLTGFKDVYLASGYLSPRQIGPALGVSHRTVISWIHSAGLPSKKLNQEIGADKKKRYRHFISPEDLWRWVRKNKERVNFALVEQGVLLPEPDWLEAEIQSSTFMKPSKTWTDQEENSAYLLWQSGIGYREIASILKRPEKGTQKKLTEIKKKRKRA